MTLIWFIVFVALCMVAPRIVGGLVGFTLVVSILLLRLLFKLALFIVVVGGAWYIIATTLL